MLREGRGGGSARLGLEGHLALSEEGGMWRQMQASLPTTYLRALPPWGPWKPEAGPLDRVKSDSL